MTFTLDNFETFLLILVRISGFVYTAPILSLKNIPVRVKAGFSIFMAVILFYSTSLAVPEYSGVIGYAILVAREAIAGTLMGLFSNIAYYILDFAGQMMDMEIGFSMVSQLDPLTNIQTSITANLYGYLVLLMMLITNLHHYFIRAVADSFKVIGLGQAVFPSDMYKLMVQFITDYFLIAMRIVLPVIAAMLIVNTVLGILTKAAPQMNMFVIGIQLKILVGLLVLYLIIRLVPSVADFIYNKMGEMLKAAVELMKGSN